MISQKYLNSLETMIKSKNSMTLLNLIKESNKAIADMPQQVFYDARRHCRDFLEGYKIIKPKNFFGTVPDAITKTDMKNIYKALRTASVNILSNRNITIPVKFQATFQQASTNSNPIKKTKVSTLIKDIVGEFKSNTPVDPNKLSAILEKKVGDYSLMHLAAKYDRDDIIKDLATMPVDFFSKKFGVNKENLTPLDIALREEKWKSANELAKFLKNIGKEKEAINIVFNYASNFFKDPSGYSKLIESLCQSGFDINNYHNKINGKTFLQEATYTLNSELVEVLLKNKAPINAVNYQDSERTALFYLMRGALKQKEDKDALNKFENIISQFKNNGIDFNYKDSEGISAIKYLFFFGYANNKDRSHLFPILDVALSYGVDPLTFDFKGNTLLHDLAARDNTSMFKKGNLWEVFTKHNVSLEVENVLGQTPLSVCYQKDDYKGFCNLIEAGADINNVKFMSGNIFTNIFLNSKEDITRNFHKLGSLLILKNVDIDVKDHMGRTPLFLAIINNNSNMFDFIVQRTKASLLDKDNFGLTAMEIMKERNLNVSSVMRAKLESLKQMHELKSFIINEIDPESTSNTINKPVKKIKLL